MRALSFLCVLMMWFMIAPPSFAADDMCPQDSTAVKNVPGDVGGVQADIDRLNLCVERAKLLKELDDIAKQRSDTLAKVKDPTGGMGNINMGGNLANGVTGIPPLPMNAFPELPAVKTPDLKPGEVRINKSDAKPFGGSDDDGKSAAKKSTWKIQKIWGQAGGLDGATMHAQISDGNGNLMNVAKGDPLPDGSIVDSVSVKGVTLSGKNPKGISKVDDLSWDEAADSGPSSGMSSNPSASSSSGNIKTSP
jgi:hypothetical protein